MIVAAASYPALISLFFKIALVAYALRSPMRDRTTRIYLALLAVFCFQNVAEIILLNDAAVGNFERASFYAHLYFAFVIPFQAMVLHLALRITCDPPALPRFDRYAFLLYLPALVLEFLLVGESLVAGFKPFQQYSLLRVPGPLYFLFETYMVVYMLASLATLAYGARTTRSGVARIRNRLWLVSLTPIGLLNIYLIVGNHFGWARITSTLYVPIALTFFLIVTTYATYQYRLLDIEFYLPWSNARKRKTAFYTRIQATVAELADVTSVDQALDRVSKLLHCSVALVGGPRPVVAIAGSDGFELAQFPHDHIEKIRHIVVSREIAHAMPQTHQLMQQFGVAAIVPFHPHTKTAASWMLLGDAFNNSVYTPLDFKMVERLFDSLGEFFLDKLAFLRAELANAKAENDNLTERLQKLEQELSQMHEKVTLVREQNIRLMRENHANRNLAEPHHTEIKKGQLLHLAPKPGSDWSKTFDEQVSKLEAKLIRQALAECGGNATDAARRLSLRPNTLRHKMEKYGISAENASSE